MSRGPMTLLRAGGLRRAGKHSALAAEPALPAFEPLAEVGALGRGQHVADIGEGVRDPPGRRIGELYLVGAQRLQPGAIDGRGGEGFDDLLARLEVLGAQREYV